VDKGQKRSTKASHLGPDLEESVPGARAERRAVNIDTEARDTIVVALEREYELTLEGVPDTAIVIVVTGKEEPARDGKGDGGDTDEDRVVAVVHDLAISPQVPEAARGIIGTGGKAEAIGHHLNGVDITLMASEGLRGFPRPNVPVLGVRVDGARDECVIGREEAERHHVTVMASEFSHLDTALDVPKHASSVTRGRDNLFVVNEATAGKVTRVGVEFSANSNGQLLALQIVDRTNIVEATARNKVVGGSIRTCHHPAGAQRDGVCLICRQSVPHK